MKVTVKLFGPLAAARAAGGEVTISTGGAAATCAAVRRRLTEMEPRLAGMIPACRFAVNGQYAAEETVIQPGDQVALIGLVSGG